MPSKHSSPDMAGGERALQTSRSVDSQPSFRILASPTSAILAVQSRPSSTLALFRSKCTILRRRAESQHMPLPALQMVQGLVKSLIFHFQQSKERFTPAHLQGSNQYRYCFEEDLRE